MRRVSWCLLSCVISSVYKRRLPFFVEVYPTCIWDVQYDIQRGDKKGRVMWIVCVLILFPIRLNCNWQRLAYLTISVTNLVSKMICMHLLQIILKINQIVATYYKQSTVFYCTQKCRLWKLCCFLKHVN